tara:strand:+ start:608 stop:736 length:129 start_codon:yes stop_codon:yes gene_type:complete
MELTGRKIPINSMKVAKWDIFFVPALIINGTINNNENRNLDL